MQKNIISFLDWNKVERCEVYKLYKTVIKVKYAFMENLLSYL